LFLGSWLLSRYKMLQLTAEEAMQVLGRVDKVRWSKISFSKTLIALALSSPVVLLLYLLAASAEAAELSTRPFTIRYIADCSCNLSQPQGGAIYTGDRIALYFSTIPLTEQPPGTRVAVITGSCSNLAPNCPNNNYPVNTGFQVIILHWLPNAPGAVYPAVFIGRVVVPP
jgi:hypothetical protein